jgi:hypothetical protein
VAAQDPSSPKQRPLALTNVTVIDGTGDGAQPDMTLIVEGGRISALGKSSQVRVPTNGEVSNLSSQQCSAPYAHYLLLTF